MLERAHVMFGCDYSIIATKGLYQDTAPWRERWPEILPTVQAFAFMTDTEGWIGRGVYRELEDSRAAGIPGYWLPDTGPPIPSSRVTTRDLTEISTRYARVTRTRPPRRRLIHQKRARKAQNRSV